MFLKLLTPCISNTKKTKADMRQSLDTHNTPAIPSDTDSNTGNGMSAKHMSANLKSHINTGLHKIKMQWHLNFKKM